MQKNRNRKVVQKRKVYSNRLKEIILYGSYARGDTTEDSDIVLIVFEGKVIPGEEIDRMIDIITEMSYIVC